MALTALDRSLVQRCLNREYGAWNDFVDRFLGLIYHVVQHTAYLRSMPLRPEDAHQAAVRHHGQKAPGLDDLGRAPAFLARIQALDVERAKLLVDAAGELRREPRKLLVIVSQKQVDGIELPRRDGGAQVIGREARHELRKLRGWR